MRHLRVSTSSNETTALCVIIAPAWFLKHEEADNPTQSHGAELPRHVMEQEWNNMQAQVEVKVGTPGRHESSDGT